MKPTTVFTVCFSPTGTSKKIATAVAQGFRVPERSSIDLTQAPAPIVTLSGQSVAIFAVPVYGGRVAPLALKRMQELRGEGTPAVVLAVYGNRAFAGAARELAAFVSQRGFVPVAAGAFIGEHSYSTPQTPIAAGRPDTTDLDAALRFGRRIGEKLAREGVTAIDVTCLREPRTPLWSLLRFIAFVVGYRRKQKKTPTVLLPVCDGERCTHCGRCVRICPSQAIAKGDELHTSASRCIRCCACVKGCPTGARTFTTPFAEALARNFRKRKPPVTIQ